MLKLIISLGFVFIAQCATNALVIKDQNRPLVELQKAVLRALPGGKRKVSVNGREFYSHYFIPNGKKYGKLAKKKIRFMTKVTILGDRRPYTLEVLTSAYKVRTSGENIVESRDLGPDKGLSRMVLRRIQSALSKSREEFNIIDDFRVF